MRVFTVLLHSQNYVNLSYFEMLNYFFLYLQGNHGNRHNRDASRNRCCNPTYLDLSIDSELVAAQTCSTECSAAASTAVVASA